MTPKIAVDILRDAAMRPTTMHVKGLTVDYEYYPNGAISKVIVSGRRLNPFDVLHMIYPRDIIVSMSTPVSAARVGGGKTVGATETKLFSVNGRGWCEYFYFSIAAAASSEATTVRIYADDQLVWAGTVSVLNASGFTASTPTVSLLNYGVDARIDMIYTKRVYFNDMLETRALNTTGAQTVTSMIYPELFVS